MSGRHILEQESEGLRELITKLTQEIESLKTRAGECRAQCMLVLGSLQAYTPIHTLYDYPNEQWVTETVMPTNVYETLCDRLEGMSK